MGDEAGRDPSAEKSGTVKDSAARSSWWKRGSTKVIAALAAGVLAGAGVLAKEGVISLGHELVASDVLSIQTRAPSPAAGCSGENGWMFPKPVDALPAPDFTNRHLNLDSWAKRNGGVPASGYFVVLTLQPVQQRTVVIDNLSVRVLHQSAPTVGTHIHFGQCGGLTPYVFQANLDANPVSIKPVKGQDAAGRTIQPVALPHELTESTPEVWNVEAVTQHCTCQWIIEVHWTSGNDSGTLRIDNHGQPFITSSTVGSTEAGPGGIKPPTWAIYPSPSPH
jgi:hypothetical protein